MRKKILEHFFCGAVFLFYCYSFTDAESDEKNRQTFVIRYKEGEQTIPVTVVLDYKKQTEYVINMNPRTPAKSVTLYDFKQRTIAYKDLTNRECFLGRLTHETLNEESNALQDMKSPVESKPKVRSLDPGRPALTPTEIRNIAGQKTAIFCRKMNTWLLIPEKVHGISKRDADEYEERTYQHHGYHTVQYSHYGHETRRRYRNPNRVNNSSHRSHRRQSTAETENKRFEIPTPSSLPGDHQLNHQSVNDFRAHDNLANVSENGNSYDSHHNLRKPYSNGNTYSLMHSRNSDDEKQRFYSGTKNRTLDPSDTNKNRFGYKIKHPSFEAEFSSASGIPIDSRPNNNATENLDFGKNHGTSVFNHGRVPHHSILSSSKGSSLPLTSEGHSRTERATSTTDVPTVPQNQEINYPNLHPSLAHLLPVYKPLSQEFEFDSPNGHESDSFSPDSNQRNVESEFNPLSPLSREQSKHGFIKHSDVHNTSFDSDVSTNVLEIPRITKEFENIKSNERYAAVPQSENSSRVFKSHILPDVYPPTSHIHLANVPFYHENGNLQNGIAPPAPHSSFPVQNRVTNSNHNIHLEENIPYIPPSEILSTTTESFGLTTPDSFVTHRLSNNLSSPPRHTTYQTADDINSFRIIPKHASNNHAHSISSENKSLKQPILKSDDIFGNENLNKNIQNSFLTTEYPFRQREYKSNSNHRSDIPSEDKDRSSRGQTTTNLGRGAYPSILPNETSSEGIPPYQIRYQSVLRDFKPDEIIIDIENIPTHPPLPVTSSFHQRMLTTVQPTIRTLSTESARSDIAIRGEQISGTTWRTFIPTTRQPRRRINDRTRRPVQHQPSFFVQKSHNRQYIKPPNQIDRNRHFIPVQHPNRNHLRYSGRPNPPSNVQIPPQLNQPQHFNQFNSLPPGISVHPRHPQAPYADMVHSNRPPTMPFVNENQALMKPHRQRHHRKKDRLANSCCRFRGKSSDLQSCCRNGGPCCTRARRRMQPPGAPCCSPSKSVGQGLPANQVQTPLRTTNQIQQPRRSMNQIQPSLRTTNQIQPLLRTANQIQPPVRTADHIQPSPRTSLHSQPPPRSEVDSKDRCQKEKMCRTLYESTQQVMVCRNALIEGC